MTWVLIGAACAAPVLADLALTVSEAGGRVADPVSFVLTMAPETGDFRKLLQFLAVRVDAFVIDDVVIAGYRGGYFDGNCFTPMVLLLAGLTLRRTEMRRLWPVWLEGNPPGT